MPMLTKEFLKSLGINLVDEDYIHLSEHFESTLHDRVINEIVLELSPAQAHELAAMQQAPDSELQRWLQQNVSGLADIVSDEVDILLGEIAEGSQAIGS